jgi:hypothetical protein
MKSGSLNLLGSSGPVPACNGIALHLSLPFILWHTWNDLRKWSSTSGAAEVYSDPAEYNDGVLRWAGLLVFQNT